jgi:hypothetical protein
MQRCRRPLRLATGVQSVLLAPTTTDCESRLRSRDPAVRGSISFPIGGNDAGASRKGGPSGVAALESACSSGSTCEAIVNLRRPPKDTATVRPAWCSQGRGVNGSAVRSALTPGGQLTKCDRARNAHLGCLRPELHHGLKSEGCEAPATVRRNDVTPRYRGSSYRNSCAHS